MKGGMVAMIVYILLMVMVNVAFGQEVIVAREPSLGDSRSFKPRYLVPNGPDYRDYLVSGGAECQPSEQLKEFQNELAAIAHNLTERDKELERLYKELADLKAVLEKDNE